MVNRSDAASDGMSLVDRRNALLARSTAREFLRTLLDRRLTFSLALHRRRRGQLLKELRIAEAGLALCP